MDLYPGKKVCRFFDYMKALFEYSKKKHFSILKICIDGCFIFYMLKCMDNLEIISYLSKLMDVKKIKKNKIFIYKTLQFFWINNLYGKKNEIVKININYFIYFIIFAFFKFIF